MVNKKIGRNELCWCGSGKKFKKCHLDRENEEPLPYHKLATDLLDLRIGDKKCLYPTGTLACPNATIRAHSISRNAALALISRAGKVYQPDSNPFEIARNRGAIVHNLVGVRQATTFTGFCSPHDQSLFRPIDKGNLTPTKEQLFLLHYRAFCREWYVKRPTLQANELLRNADRGKTPDVQKFVQELVTGRGQAIDDSIKKMEADKSACDRMLLSRDYGDILACVLKFNQLPTLACSGLTQPIYDFSGGSLQKLDDMTKPLFNLSFTLLPNGPGGIAALIWLREADSICRAFVSSLVAVQDDRKSDAMVQLVFDSFENHAIQPEWWDTLPDQSREELANRILNWADARPINDKALMMGSRKFANWGFDSVMWM